MAKVTNRHLLRWYFEDCLKTKYFELLKTLESLSHDTLVAVKLSSLNITYELLVNKPEQEQNLLRLLVNKLVSEFVVYFVTFYTIGRFGKKSGFKIRLFTSSIVGKASCHEDGRCLWR